MKNTISARLIEKYRESEFAPASTAFLSPGEIRDAYEEALPVIGGGLNGCFFWGGCRGAERCAAVFLPEWYLTSPPPPHRLPGDDERAAYFDDVLAEFPELRGELPVRCLKITGGGFASLSHRDYMGAILSLGIDRSVVGDIAVISENEAVVFVHEKIESYIMENLTKIGREGVKCTEITPPHCYILPRRYESVTAVVSSPRLDGVVKALTPLSREEAAEHVRSGLVELSYRETTDVSAAVKENDILSVRGYGKFRIGKILGETKSGRLKLEVFKYI